MLSNQLFDTRQLVSPKPVPTITQILFTKANIPNIKLISPILTKTIALIVEYTLLCRIFQCNCTATSLGQGHDHDDGHGLGHNFFFYKKKKSKYFFVHNLLKNHYERHIDIFPAFFMLLGQVYRHNWGNKEFSLRIYLFLIKLQRKNTF